MNILFFMTNISYSFNNDMDLDLIGQFYFGENPIKFESLRGIPIILEVGDGIVQKARRLLTKSTIQNEFSIR